MLAGVMSACLSVSAFAADITINGQGEKFEAYQLLSLTTSLKTGDHGHEGDTHDASCYNYSYTVNEKYREALKTVTGEVDDAGIISHIGEMSADSVRAFADSMYAQVKSLGADETASGKTFSGADQGYYLIVESQNSADPDSVSLVMLDTAGQENVTVSTKEGVPTLEKKIVDAGSDVDAADYAIGDTVSFKLTGTMPDNIDGYKTYMYIFHDSLSRGLSLKADSIKVTVDGVAASDYFVKTEGLDEGCSFEIVFNDIKASRSITKDAKVIVTYDAELTAAADIGNPGNPNTARLEFSNDPYTEGDTSTTPDDKVAAFTFEVTVNKTDRDNNPLAGANFKLQIEEDGEFVDYKEYALADGQTKFTFTGLDAGKYKLVETKVPDGYNRADDVEFEIAAAMDENSDDPKLTNLVVKQGDKILSEGDDALFTISIDAGTATTSVVNHTGIRLPSTGGMGTYAIYGGGGALIAGGIILTIMKKKEENS